MSGPAGGVDPSWPPPRRPDWIRAHPRALLGLVIAVLGPLTLIVTLGLPVGLVYGLLHWRPAPIVVPVPPPVPTTGAPGLGDPYYPEAGNSGYDVSRYQIAISWNPSDARLTGTTTISARSEHQLTSFFLDLALTTDAVRVNGTPATFIRSGTSDLQITPAVPVGAGAPFEVAVDYSGRPGDVPAGEFPGWWATGQEWTAAGEPESAAWWFPSNDHPSDPALMDVSVRVPAGLEAISVGRLASRDSGNEKDFDTWHWVARQPMATYLNFVTIGQYALREETDDGRPAVYAVSEQLPADQQEACFRALKTSAARVRTLETMFGPYPFSELGGVVPIHDLWFDGLETQTRPVYAAKSLLNPRYADELLTHELSHMWFGDQVTVRRWDDIFDNEAYASWAPWGFVERTGGERADVAFRRTFDQLADQPRFWRITMIDPGRNHLFDAVYTRGPMALQALRNVIGDEAFFRLSRDWAQNPGTRSLEEWMAQAQVETTVNLGPFFRVWIFGSTAPARTPANGFG